jgi:protein-disulfide isomerase
MRLLLQLDFDLEYGDYEYPYTGMAYPIVKKIMREFGDDKTCFVFGNFPLNDTHPHARHAAEAIEAVAGKIKTCHL